MILTAIAYAMLDHGISPEETKKLMDKINYVSESIAGDWVKFSEITRALKDEYDFEIAFDD